jgi:hypothetical protein
MVKKTKNFPKNPKNGGTPAREKNTTTRVEFIKELVLKNLYSDKVLNKRVSNIKKIEKKKTSVDTYTKTLKKIKEKKYSKPLDIRKKL